VVLVSARKIDSQEHDDAAPYKRWQAQKWITGTSGNVTDYDQVKLQILQVMKQFYVIEIGFDRWNALQLANELLDLGVPLVEIPQNTVGCIRAARSWKSWSMANSFSMAAIGTSLVRAEHRFAVRYQRQFPTNKSRTTTVASTELSRP
jgi:phage terminase large subunit-like protein